MSVLRGPSQHISVLKVVLLGVGSAVGNVLRHCISHDLRAVPLFTVVARAAEGPATKRDQVFGAGTGQNSGHRVFCGAWAPIERMLLKRRYRGGECL